MINQRRSAHILLAILPFAAIIGLWVALPYLIDFPAYKLPPPEKVFSRAQSLIASGTLFWHVVDSLWRLAVGFILGNILAIPIGVAIGLNRHASDFLMPLLTFLQSIAGIAWVPLAVLWFGLGDGAIIFVIANIIFFSNLYNAVVGVESIPTVYYRAAKSLGASQLDVLFSVVLPGAFTQLLVGLRSSMAFGWRALVGAELIAGTTGIGYMTLEAVEWYQTETVVLGMIIVGLLWLVMDKFLFTSVEDRTVRKWGLIQEK
jgi:ABC-type nitrate/sulfonate/bicarbonate transport system permease component